MELKLMITQTKYYQAFLLIVPYGIETRLHCQSVIFQTPFNRTLWN